METGDLSLDDVNSLIYIIITSSMREIHQEEIEKWPFLNKDLRTFVGSFCLKDSKDTTGRIVTQDNYVYLLFLENDSFRVSKFTIEGHVNYSQKPMRDFSLIQGGVE